MSSGFYNQQGMWQTAVTNNTASYMHQQYPVQQTYTPPPIWHSFPCGHQMKLEPGQPSPVLCPTCPPPEYENHTYPKCGHAHSYRKGQPIPSACPECFRLDNNKRREAEMAAKAAAEAEAKRLDDKKDLRVWLDREVSRVTVGAAL